MIVINMAAAVIGLLIGSITDMKTREVPDWLNYSLICFGIGAHVVYALVFWNAGFLLRGAAGFGLCFILAAAMYYSGQWGGGDSKMLMALGALIGFDIFLFRQVQFLYSLLLHILFAGAVYGLVWSAVLIFRHRKAFSESFKRMMRQQKVKALRGVLFGVAVLGGFSIYWLPFYSRVVLVAFLALLFFVFYAWVGVKAVEECCMIKKVKPSKLTEGDWIVEDVYVGKKRICGSKDLGVSKAQIAELIEFYKQKKVGLITIKEGIPFVPSFFIAFAATLLFKNWFLVFF